MDKDLLQKGSIKIIYISTLMQLLNETINTGSFHIACEGLASNSLTITISTCPPDSSWIHALFVVFMSQRSSTFTSTK